MAAATTEQSKSKLPPFASEEKYKASNCPSTHITPKPRTNIGRCILSVAARAGLRLRVPSCRKGREITASGGKSSMADSLGTHLEREVLPLTNTRPFPAFPFQWLPQNEAILLSWVEHTLSEAALNSKRWPRSQTSDGDSHNKITGETPMAAGEFQ